MKKLLAFVFVIHLLTFNFISLIAQEENKDKKFNLKLTGYIKYDMFYDSRQIVDSREGHLVMFPQNVELDEDGKDINARGSFNFLSIQSRVALKITGPDILNAKTSGFMEGEFLGTTNANINSLRLRHAYIKLDWKRSELLLGQYWHPLFPVDCFPGTVSFNTGMCFQPFARNPQIRYTAILGLFNISFTAFSERDFPSRGLDGSANSAYVRNSGIPSLNVNIQHSNKKVSIEDYFVIGLGGNFKSMLPQLETSANYVTSQKVNAFSAIAYFRKKNKYIDFKISAAYGENSTDFLMVGGFAVLDTIDFLKKDVSYIPLRNVTTWIDISTTGKMLRFGIFTGYNRNIGTNKDIHGSIYGYYTNIKYLYRISPRVDYFIKNLQVGMEFESTIAAFGDGSYSRKAIPMNTREVMNWRILLGIYYHF
ncbi:MAG: hypothetical protein LBQ22_12895 [Bacteroidales bacterium]|jgi:hypothetical protein|nr:hypothetical protein [Bacteroidales bacterium]